MLNLKNKSNWPLLFFFILIGATILLTEKPDGGVIDEGISATTSAHGITLAKNLLIGEHPFFMFSHKNFNNGKVTFEAYNRFPVFPFLLMGILISPFDESLSFQVYILRQTMNLFYILTMIVTFYLVFELLGNKYIAFATTLLSFSSYYQLTYKDLIFNDIPSLLGLVLLFYCIVIAQKKYLKPHQIIFYSLIPISFGWQPYAVLITWVFINLLEILLRKNLKISEKISFFIKEQSVKIMVMSIIWGIIILGFQLIYEWLIVGGSFIDLPSINSGLWRTGIAYSIGHTTNAWVFDWLIFLPSQFHIMVTSLIPFWPIFQIDFGYYAPILIVILLIVYSISKFVSENNIYNKSILIMTLSGLLWSIPMRHFVALHEFQSIFYIGFSLSFNILILSKIKIYSWKLLTINLLIFFMLSVALNNYSKSPFSTRNTIEFQKIQTHLPSNSKVFFDGEPKGNTRYVELYLVGKFISPLDEADYAISRNPDFIGKKLTQNKYYNLFLIQNNSKK